MIIQCGNCSRKFKIEESRIKPGGSKVRCSKCGHIFLVQIPGGTGEQNALTDVPEHKAPDIDTEINIERETPDIGVPDDRIPDNRTMDKPIDSAGEDSADYSLDESGSTGEEKSYKESPQSPSGLSGEDIPGPDIDNASTDAGGWEEFVSISKTGAEREQIETETSGEPNKPQKDFNWENLSLDEESGDSPKDIPEMFEDEDTGSPEEPAEKSASETTTEPDGPPSDERPSEKLILDTHAPSRLNTGEEDFGPLESGYHKSAGVYRPEKKSKGGILSKIVYNIMIAAVLVVIVIGSISILVNLELIPEENITKVRTLVESFLPIKLSQEPAQAVIITEHGGNWIDTRSGPLYVISGMIRNTSPNPVNYIQIKSEFLAAGQTLYEDTTYAGNTFSERELKVSKLEDIVLKLKKKNGDIDYYNTNKLAGLNYKVQPGESIPFFAVFPNESTVLGLKYNLEIIDYEDTSIN
jgi:predicted Zn finger-like uncharacterized protein